MPPKRKRPVTSCTQCYLKKQKCNHQYPCNHCTQRRRPELCSYSRDTAVDNGQFTLPAAELSDSTKKSSSSEPYKQQSCTIAPEYGSVHEQNLSQSPVSRLIPRSASISGRSLLSSFGYFEWGDSNLLAYMKAFDLHNDELAKSSNSDVSNHVLPRIKECLRLLPKRSIIDCLIQNFFKEVNWIAGMIHSPTFLTYYECWWNIATWNQAEEVEFGVLLLRICAHGAQFLPSHAYTADTISGIAISVIREHCDKLATEIASLSESAAMPRSLTSVQYLYFAACYLENEDRMKEAWLVVGNAVRLALDLGMHLETTTASLKLLNDIERETRRRVFWNLYVCDKFLSLALDRPSYIPDDYCSVAFPKLRLATDMDDLNAPDVFQERVLQAQLMRLWYSKSGPLRGRREIYDPTIAEERCERLREFSDALPSVFDLENPNTEWDRQLPVLIRQRQMLRISIHVLLCHIFRPTLRLSANDLQSMPQYKRDLVLLHRKYLVDAASSLLNNISCLHDLMGGNHTKFFLLSFYTFEPAMLLGMHLLSINSTRQNLAQAQSSSAGKLLRRTSSDLRSIGVVDVDRQNLAAGRSQLEKALIRLKILREVSVIADIGARKLSQVISRLEQMTQADSSESEGLDRTLDPWRQASPVAQAKSTDFSIDLKSMYDGQPQTLLASNSSIPFMQNGTDDFWATNQSRTSVEAAHVAQPESRNILFESLNDTTLWNREMPTQSRTKTNRFHNVSGIVAGATAEYEGKFPSSTPPSIFHCLSTQGTTPTLMSSSFETEQPRHGVGRNESPTHRHDLAIVMDNQVDQESNDWDAFPSTLPAGLFE